MIVAIPNMMNKIVAGIVLAMIYAGIITSPDQLNGEVDKTELKYMAGAAEIENGNETDKPLDDMLRLLLTMSVIKNRIDSDNWKGSCVEEVILAKGQYAPVTRNGFKTKKAKERTVLLAKYISLYGAICPPDVVYQGQRVNGHGKMIDGKLVHEYARIPVKGDRDEVFCYE